MFETPKSFAPYHARDRAFFLVFAALAWIAVIMGFGPEVDGQLKGRAPFPPLIVHVHAVIFVGWLVLFTAQVWLISKRRPDIHRRPITANPGLAIGPQSVHRITWPAPRAFSSAPIHVQRPHGVHCL